MTEAPKRKRLSPKYIREKGLVFERELVTYLSDNLGIPLARGVAGAQAFDKSKGSSDIFGLPHLAVEAKRTERFTINEFMAQAVRNATVDMPVLIHRSSRQKTEHSSVVLRLEDFARIYDAYLRFHGFKPDDR